MSFLSVNLGNSRLSLAYFENGKITAKAGLPIFQNAVPFLPAFCEGKTISRIAFCSVNPPLEKRIVPMLHSFGAAEVLQIGVDLPVGILNRCRRPEQVGLDRLLVARAAFGKLKKAVLVLDFGTAITANAVSEKGEFLGGAIAPGFRLSAKALHDGTALLPEAKLALPSSLIGKDTEEAIGAGIHFGLLGLAEKWIQQAKQELGSQLAVVATGGDLERVREIQGIEHFWPDLLHEGIHLIAHLEKRETK